MEEAVYPGEVPTSIFYTETGTCRTVKPLTVGELAAFVETAAESVEQ